MEVYREVEEFGRNEEESSSLGDFMAHLLHRRRDVCDVERRIGDIHLGDLNAQQQYQESGIEFLDTNAVPWILVKRVARFIPNSERRTPY